MGKLLNTILRLSEALKNGEIVQIVYNGGSQPGTRREIVPLKIDDGELMAKCFQSNSVKTFKIEKIELLANDTDDENIPVYDSSIEKIKLGQNLRTQQYSGKVKKHKSIVLKGVFEKSAFSGKVFLFTGALASLTRDEAKELVESLGGETASSVSKRVDFVVAGEEAGSKYAKAKKLGLRVLNEEEFRKMVGR